MSESNGHYVATLPKKTMLQFNSDEGKEILSVDVIEMQLAIEEVCNGRADFMAWADAFISYLKLNYSMEATVGQAWSIVSATSIVFDEIKKKSNPLQTYSTGIQESVSN